MIKSYDKLPIGAYLRIAEITENIPDELQRNIAIISVLSGIPEEEILEMPYEKVEKMTSDAGFLLTQPRPAQVRKVYEVGEWRLVPTLKKARITASQYIDFQELTARGVEEYFAQILACFLIPEGKKYNDGYDIEEVGEALREHLSIVDANALYAFFLRMFSKSIASTLNYLKAKIMLHIAKTEEEKKVIAEAMQAMTEFQRLVKSGGGPHSSISFLALPEMLGA